MFLLVIDCERCELCVDQLLLSLVSFCRLNIICNIDSGSKITYFNSSIFL